MSTNKLANLASNFVECYHDFDNGFNSWVKAHGRPTEENPSYLMFGTSGAGKSTLIARMLSDKEPTAFMEHIQGPAREGFVMLNGVKLGKDPLVSTTLIPKAYHIGGLSIFDMPGFSDTDPSRDIIIGVLHKCLLTRIKAAKFIVVLGIEVLTGSVEAKTILSYCEAFSRLFGDAYASGLNHVYFVFTKNDKHKLDADQVDLAMFKLMKGAGSLGNALVNPFLSRMASHNVVVDYTTVVQPFDALRTMIEADQQGKGEVLSAGKLNINHLAAHESQLTVRCGEEVTKVAKSVDDTSKDFQRQHDQVKREMAAVRTMAKSHVKEHMEQLGEMSKLAAELAEIDKRLATFNEDNGKLQQKLATFAGQVSFAARQIEFLEKGLADFDVVSLRCDVALVPPAGITGRRPAKLELTIDLGHHGRGEAGQYIILITVAEPQDRTLMSHIAATERTDPTLQPQRLSTIAAFKNDIVLYHSQHAINRFGRKDGDKLIVSTTPGQEYIQIVGEYPQAFKVYVYYAVKFTTTPEYRKLRAKYEEESSEFERQRVHFAGQIEELEKNNRVDLRRRTELLQNHKVVAQRLHDSTRQLHQEVKSMNNTMEQKQTSLQSYLKAARSEEYPMIGQVTEVSNIYTANNLVTNLMESLVKVQDTLQHLRSTIQSAIGETSKTCSALATEMEEAMLARPTVPDGLLLPTYNF